VRDHTDYWVGGRAFCTSARRERERTRMAHVGILLLLKRPDS
jgi:hypothetical protein